VVEKTLLRWEELLVPEKSMLLPNYPNPFNPETWIPYQLAVEGNVTIHIYNAGGHLIRTLDIGYKESGLYFNKERAAHWDGVNNQGERVASGMYFYTLCVKKYSDGNEVGMFTDTRKMVIMK